MIDFFANPSISLAIVQIVGLLILFAGFDSDEQILAKSGTYWNYNHHMAQHLITNAYDQKIGIFSVTLPTMLQAINTVPFWTSYICLFLAIVLRFSCIRRYSVDKRVKEIDRKYEERQKRIASKLKPS